MSDWIWALIIGFVLDLLLGDPAWLYHPVCIICLLYTSDAADEL